MTESRIVAVSLGREFDTERLERLFPGKVFSRWEEPLVLDVHGMEVYVFAFGVVVFFDYRENTARSFLEKLKGAVLEPTEVFVEEYLWKGSKKPVGRSIRVGGKEVWVKDDALYGELDEDGKKVVALVLAQSAALRRVEKETDELMEVVEGVLDELITKPIILSLSRLRRSLLEALKARGALLNDLFILEKPHVAWEEEGYERLFERLRYVFEIEERFNVMAKKLSAVVETAEMASQLVSDARFFILEFLIVLFLLVEVLSLFW